MVTASQYILGIKPDFEGLRIEPCLPSEWEGYSATRDFRGARYEIEVVKPKGLCTGVREVHVNGQKMEGNLVPAAGLGETAKVKVRMG